MGSPIRLSHPGRKNMRCTILVLSLAVFYATASIDDVVPEDNLYAFDDDLSEAQQKINEMTAAGASDKKCRELVTTTRKDIETNVNNCQAIMNALPDGSDCSNRGQAEVKVATELKVKAHKYYQTTITEVTKTSSASVNFGSRTFISLTEGKCDSFYSSTSYTTAKAAYDSAVTARTKAKGAYEQAVKNLAIAVEAAAKAKKECLCKTRTDHENAFAKHTAANAANQKAWNFACKLECVLDKKTSCSCSAAPMCKRAKVTAEVKEVDCTVKKMCCRAMNAKCLACTKGMSEAEYCRVEGSDKKISGCAPKCDGKEPLKFTSASQTGTMSGHNAVTYGPKRAIDGHSTTRQGMKGPGAWTGDFGKVVDLRQLRVDWEACQCRNKDSVLVQVSTDNKSWKNCGYWGGFHQWGKSGDRTHDVEKHGCAGKARYVRYTTTKNMQAGQWMSMWEASGYGCQ